MYGQTKNYYCKIKNYCKIKMGGGIFVKFLSINLQMKINSLKPYSPPVVEVLNVELEQSVLGNSISTESLEEETYNW